MQPVAGIMQWLVWRKGGVEADTQVMLATLKIAVGMLLVLMLLPAAMLLRAEKRDVVVHTVRGDRGIGPEVVGVEVRLWGRRAFFGVECREPL